MIRQFNNRTRSQISRANAVDGHAAELLARNHLLSLGVQCLADIPNDWRVHRRGGQIVSATPKAKVAGDMFGLTPSGRGVLVEVKKTTQVKGAVKLSLSAFKKHQPPRLDAWNNAGGLAIVVWVCFGHGVIALPWPISELRKGSPLYWVDAEAMRIRGVE